MQTYTLPVQFQFNGTIEVQATSLEEAQSIIKKNIHASHITIQNDQDNEPTDYRSITDYSIDMK